MSHCPFLLVTTTLRNQHAFALNNFYLLFSQTFFSFSHQHLIAPLNILLPTATSNESKKQELQQQKIKFNNNYNNAATTVAIFLDKN